MLPWAMTLVCFHVSHVSHDTFVCFPKAMNCQQRKRQMSEFLSLVEDMLHRGPTHTHLRTDNLHNLHNAHNAHNVHNLHNVHNARTFVDGFHFC